MKTYILNGKPFDVEEGITYLDCFISASRPQLEPVWPDYYLDILAHREVELGRSAWDGQFSELFRQASRWANEAERQKFHQELIRIGVKNVWDHNYKDTFDCDEADIINWLANWGKLALRVLEHYGDKRISRLGDPVRKIPHAEAGDAKTITRIRQAVSHLPKDKQAAMLVALAVKTYVQALVDEGLISHEDQLEKGILTNKRVLEALRKST